MRKMVIGDRVKLKYHPHNILGTIRERRLDGKCVVKFDDTELVPPFDSYEPHTLRLLDYLDKPVIWNKNKCECGQNKETWVIHSDYCPLYREIK